MKIYDKLFLDFEGLKQNGPITIAVFGDSITHGFFETGVTDYEAVYWNVLTKKLHQIRDYVPINIINAGIGGITASASVSLFEERVLIHRPDLIIICFGLNDVCGDICSYTSSLEQIFTKCKGIDTIFMTPNMLNTYVDENIDDALKKYAYITKEAQCSGKMDSFIQSAISVAEKMNVTVCDCYSIWKKMSQTTDTTALLANKINHPCRELHNLFADELYKIICKK